MRSRCDASSGSLKKTRTNRSGSSDISAGGAFPNSFGSRFFLICAHASVKTTRQCTKENSLPRSHQPNRSPTARSVVSCPWPAGWTRAAKHRFSTLSSRGGLPLSTRRWPHRPSATQTAAVRPVVSAGDQPRPMPSPSRPSSGAHPPAQNHCRRHDPRH